MHASYQDITSRIPEAPQWWDANGTPRYGAFTAHLCPDIYAQQVVLLEIACQDCQRHFLVAMHGSLWHNLPHPQTLHYGDPPSHGCVGDTMNCEDLAVREVWVRLFPTGWERRPALEGPIAAARDPFAPLRAPWAGEDPHA